MNDDIAGQVDVFDLGKSRKISYDFPFVHRSVPDLFANMQKIVYHL